MARITARQAFTRSRARRENQRSEQARVINEARRKYIRQLTDLGLMATENRQVTNSSLDDDDSSGSGSQKSEPSKFPRKLPIHGRKIRLRRGAENNKKITDYFTVQSRGRENLPKSPQLIVRTSTNTTTTTPRQLSRTGTPSSTPRYSREGNIHSDVEIVTLSDSDDDSNDNTVSSIACHLSVKSEQFDNSDNPSLPITSPFKDLSVKVDEDIEIVDMLPPIPLREHPVFEIEEL